MIPMRDGVRLKTVVHLPKDHSERHPILIERTPYSSGPYGEGKTGWTWVSPLFAKENYILVHQDVRGRYLSEGDFVDVRPSHSGPKGTDETTDTYDTVDWLVKNLPDNNGRVGINGISYPGFYASLGAIDTHPAVKAVSPEAPVTNWWMGDDFHHHGALMLEDAFGFYASFGVPRPKPTENYAASMAPSYTDSYRFFLELGPLANVNRRYFRGQIQFWNDLMAHPNYDMFWKERDVRPRLKNIRCAVLNVGGFFDAEDMWGALETYRAIERQNPGITNTLVMGPWSHGMWASAGGNKFGDIDWGSPTSDVFRDKVHFAFFNHYLKDGPDPKLPEAMVFDSGTKQWRSFENFPPKPVVAKNWFLADKGQLTSKPPAVVSRFDHYVSDPAHPVPYVDGTTNNRGAEYMIADQRFASRRPDVLTYRSEPLAAPTTLAGPLAAELFASTSTTDADFIVKVIDEFPADEPNRDGVTWGGYQMLVRAEVVRGRFRNNPERPTAFRPGEPSRVVVPLNDVFHTFQKGHRLTVQIQSSWFPLVDRNPQTFVNPATASEADFKPASIRIYRDQKHPTHIRALVLPTAK